MSDRRRIPLWLWALTIAALVLLVVALVGRDKGPSLQAVPVDASMTNDQAREAAEKTLLVWVRERNAGNVKNLQELTCPNAPAGWVSRQLYDAETGQTPAPWTIVALTGFTRNGTDWTINGLGSNQGGMFTLSTDGGRLRVCSRGPVPVPAG